MKKCPNCGAEISDEARYCIHCMTPLIAKQEAKEPKRNHARLFAAIGVASLVLAAAVLLILLLPKMQRKPSDGPQDTLPGSETAETTEPVTEETTQKEETETGAEAVTTEDEPETQEDPCLKGHDYVKKTVRAATCTEDGEEVYECTRCDAKNVVRLPALGHQFQEATCLQPKICVRCRATNGAPLGHLVKFGICGRCGNEVENAPRSAEIAAENARHEEALAEINAEYAEIDSMEDSAKPVFTRYNEPFPPKKTSMEYYNLYLDWSYSLSEAQINYRYLNPSDPNYEIKKAQQESWIEDCAYGKARYEALSDAAGLYERAKARRSANDEKLTEENALHESNLIAIDDKYR